MATLYLCGAANTEGVRLALTINQNARRWDRIVLLDDNPAKHGQTILGAEITGSFSLLAHGDPRSDEVVNLVTRTTAKRWMARGKIQTYGLPFATLIHPSVDVSGVDLEKDITIFQYATVGPRVTVGEGSVIFMGAIAGHECTVGRCCILAPNAVINARVRLAAGAYVGTNASVLPDVKVGTWATIAAGSVAMLDVPDYATVLGVPAKILCKAKPNLGALTPQTGP
jgi:sugar O-acyltransferase (sialic acid O-acetyltransferase NeuD family)